MGTGEGEERRFKSSLWTISTKETPGASILLSEPMLMMARLWSSWSLGMEDISARCGVGLPILRRQLHLHSPLLGDRMKDQ